MYAGSIRVAVVDENGGSHVDDAQAGDIWFFPKGMAHVLQGMLLCTQPQSGFLIMIGLHDSNEFLLAFDDGLVPNMLVVSSELILF